MTIISYPNECLKVTTKAVHKITPELAQIAKDMYKLMCEAGGIGLASPQVGLDIKLFVLDDNGEPIYLFNPTILEKSKDTVQTDEQCLSFGDKTVRVKRAKEVTMKYRDINNKMQYRVFTGILAVAAQHEYDHLQGRTFDYYEEIN